MFSLKQIRLTPVEMHGIELAIIYIGKNYQNKISAEQLAIEVNLAKEKLQAGIRRRTTLGLHEYIVQTRINKSKELLLNTDHPLKIIASNIGFSDKSYYCKVFRKLEGITPKEFRLSQVV